VMLAKVAIAFSTIPGVRGVKRVGGLARLEKRVRILRRASHDGPLRRQRPASVRPNEVVADHQADFVIRQQRELIEFVRGAKTIEKMQEGTRLSSVAA